MIEFPVFVSESARTGMPVSDRASMAAPDNPEIRLRAAAKRFEAVFLAEMLRHAGVGKMSEGFGGGPGEAAFRGHLTQAYADEIAERGGLGLADQVYRSMRARLGS